LNEKAGCFAPVKTLAGKIVSKMTYIVPSGTLNPTQINPFPYVCKNIIVFATTPSPNHRHITCQCFVCVWCMNYTSCYH